MRYMLDTNICIYAIKNRPESVIGALRENESAGIGLSSITMAELCFGAQKSKSARNIEMLQRFFEPLEIAEFDPPAADIYGRLRHQLESAGTPIGPLDTLIAAHALSLDVILVSNNIREFQRVLGLKLENWATTSNLG